MYVGVLQKRVSCGISKVNLTALVGNAIMIELKVSDLSGPGEQVLENVQALAQLSMRVMYVDGGCNNKTGVGAYCFVFVHMPRVVELLHSTDRKGHIVFGYSQKMLGVTNNIMEIMAVLQGLRACNLLGYVPEYIVTDSQYVQKGIDEWSHFWITNNWKGTTGKPVANQNLWKQLLQVYQPLRSRMVHVAGHRGVYWNEFCDTQCTKSISQSSLSLLRIHG